MIAKETLSLVHITLDEMTELRLAAAPGETVVAGPRAGPLFWLFNQAGAGTDPRTAARRRVGRGG